MSISNNDFGSSIPSLSLTLNVEPWTCERLRYFFYPRFAYFINRDIFQLDEMGTQYFIIPVSEQSGNSISSGVHNRINALIELK